MQSKYGTDAFQPILAGGGGGHSNVTRQRRTPIFLDNVQTADRYIIQDALFATIASQIQAGKKALEIGRDSYLCKAETYAATKSRMDTLRNDFILLTTGETLLQLPSYSVRRKQSHGEKSYD